MRVRRLHCKYVLTSLFLAHRQCARTEAAKAAERKRASDNESGTQTTEISAEDAAAALEEGMFNFGLPSQLGFSMWSTLS